jgi:ABC-2 type transport system ATP-binding protein
MPLFVDAPPPAPEVVINVEGLLKVYGDTVAVDNASFTVARGEIFGLLGPNGAGKTTTVECLQGLRIAERGSIDVLGFDPRRHATALRRRIGGQLQQSALPDHIKVWEALDLFASFIPGGHDWRVLMRQWDLEGKRSATFHSLSGGQRQRLFVALALVNDPEIVFLDEMTTGLDPAARRLAWELIREIRDRGTTVVLVTHFMDEAEKLCDRIGVMEGGRFVAIDTPRGLVESHAGGVCLAFTTDADDVSWLGGLGCVDSVQRHGRRVEVEGSGPVLALVAAALVERGIVPDDLHLEQPTLEDAYLHLTGHAMRD